MFYYAQLDENSICIGVSQLSGEVSETNMILLDRYDASLMGKKYNNGTWEDVPQPEPTPTSQDAINAEILKMLNDLQLKLGGASNV